MAKKLVVLCALVAASSGSVVPVARADADYTSFAYDVANPNTDDFKDQVETRVGGVVQGQYSLLDSYGTKRTVDYAADDVNDFNAVVRKDPVFAPAVVAAVPEVVAARTVGAAAVVAAHTYAASSVYAAPSLYASSAPAVFAARTYPAPSVYAAAPSVYTAASPVVAARSYAAPSVYSAPAAYW